MVFPLNVFSDEIQNAHTACLVKYGLKFTRFFPRMNYLMADQLRIVFPLFLFSGELKTAF